MTSFARRFLLCAIGYVLAGMSLGIYMGATENFVLAPVHAHMNLIGWATMGLFAYYYNAVPKAGETTLAQIHFWVAQAGLIMIIPGLALMLTGNTSAVPVLIAGELFTVLSMLMFAFTVYRNKGA